VDDVADGFDAGEDHGAAVDGDANAFSGVIPGLPANRRLTRHPQSD
jgi:hypothetical protein